MQNVSTKTTQAGHKRRRQNEQHTENKHKLSGTGHVQRLTAQYETQKVKAPRHEHLGLQQTGGNTAAEKKHTTD